MNIEVLKYIFYFIGIISFSIYLVDKIKEKIQDYNFRKHAQKQIDKFEEMTGIDYLKYQEMKFDKVIEEAIKSNKKETENEL